MQANVYDNDELQTGKESTCNTEYIGDSGSVPGLGRSPEGGKWQFTLIVLPEKSHGQWGRKESDKAEQLTHIQIKIQTFSNPIQGQALGYFHIACFFVSLKAFIGVKAACSLNITNTSVSGE